AGLCIATLLYKPPLGIVIGPLLLLKRRWRVVGGVAVGATGLLLLSLLVSARALVDYPAAVRAFSQEMATEQSGLYNLQYDLLSFVTVSMDDRLPRCLGRARVHRCGVCLDRRADPSAEPAAGPVAACDAGISELALARGGRRGEGRKSLSPTRVPRRPCGLSRPRRPARRSTCGPG